MAWAINNCLFPRQHGKSPSGLWRLTNGRWGVLLIETGQAEVAYRKAQSTVSSPSGKDGARIINQNVLRVEGTPGHAFAWTMPQEKFTALEPVLGKILVSFELAKP